MLIEEFSVCGFAWTVAPTARWAWDQRSCKRCHGTRDILGSQKREARPARARAAQVHLPSGARGQELSQ
jgi:hypothetical protein